MKEFLFNNFVKLFLQKNVVSIFRKNWM